MNSFPPHFACFRMAGGEGGRVLWGENGEKDVERCGDQAGQGDGTGWRQAEIGVRVQFGAELM